VFDCYWVFDCVDDEREGWLSLVSEMAAICKKAADFYAFKM